MKILIAANWKMHKNAAEAQETIRNLRALVGQTLPCTMVLFPPATALYAATEALQGLEKAHTGVQNIYPAASGAFTGEISPAMARDAGASWVLVGHSERRHIFGESDAFIAEKTAYCLQEGLQVMLCIGEKLEEREQGDLRAVLHRQLSTALEKLPQTAPFNAIAIAYEPVWAIGTGKTASEQDVLEAHALVRELLVSICGEKAKQTHILYGGSVKADNAARLLTLDNVGGLLVGGASLQAESFATIVQAAKA